MSQSQPNTVRAATIHGNSDGRRRSSSGGESGESGNSWVDSRELSMHRAKHSSTDVNDTGGYAAVVVDDENNRCNNSSSSSGSSGGGSSRTRSHGGSGGGGGDCSNVMTISNIHSSSGSTTGTDSRTSCGSGDRLADAVVDAVEEDSPPSLSLPSSLNKKSHAPLTVPSSSSSLSASPSSSSSYSFVSSPSAVGTNSKSSPLAASSGSATGSTVINNSNNNSTKAGKKIELTYEEMARYFNAPQPLAARLLGVSYVFYQMVSLFVCPCAYLFPLLCLLSSTFELIPSCVYHFLSMCPSMSHRHHHMHCSLSTLKRYRTSHFLLASIVCVYPIKLLILIPVWHP